MRFELVGVAKVRVANFANIWFLSCVDSQMPAKVGHLHKLPVTVSACIRLFTRVEPHVSFQMMISGEAFATNFALKWLLTGVCTLVVLQNVFIAERSVADFACEDFIPAILLAVG